MIKALFLIALIAGSSADANTLFDGSWVGDGTFGVPQNYCT